MKTLFIVAYGGGHINTQLAVADSYLNLGWKVIFLSVPNTTKLLKSIGKYKVYTFLDIADDDSLRLGEEILDKVHNYDTGIDVEESKAYAGVNYKDLKKIYGNTNAKLLIENFSRRIFLPIHSIKKLMGSIKPDLVSVTLSAARAERASIIAAKILGIKVMAFEDLFGTACAFSIYDQLYVENTDVKKDLISKGVPEENVIVQKDSQKNFQVASFHTGVDEYIGLRYKFVPDYVFAINDYAKKQLISRGLPSDIIHVVGQPAFDKISKKIKCIQNIEKEKLVVVTTQPLDTRSQFLQLIKNAIVKLSKEYKIIIRFHPSSDGKAEKQIFANINSNIIVDRSHDLHEILIRAELVITQTSTTGIEAAITKTNVLSLSLGNDNLVSFEEAGISKELVNPSEREVNDCIDKILTGSYKKITDGLTYCDGRSVNRVIEITDSN
ncbi:MAG: UDP-N-acetylglucosamine 2-epimerase [Bacillota bacterium]|nr:UDP-N-acetylglucosamine 2-epimerase [Bacillota bacterium]